MYTLHLLVHKHEKLSKIFLIDIIQWGNNDIIHEIKN